MGQPRRISFDEGANCEPGDYETVAVGGRLAVFGRFPMKAGGHGCSAKGGYFLIDPANGAATPRMAAGVHLAALTAGADNFLYGVDVADLQPGQMALVKLDSATGETRVRKAVPADVWHLSVGTIPAEWSGKLDLQAIVR